MAVAAFRTFSAGTLQVTSIGFSLVAGSELARLAQRGLKLGAEISAGFLPNNIGKAISVVKERTSGTAVERAGNAFARIFELPGSYTVKSAVYTMATAIAIAIICDFGAHFVRPPKKEEEEEDIDEDGKTLVISPAYYLALSSVGLAYNIECTPAQRWQLAFMAIPKAIMAIGKELLPKKELADI